MEKVYKVGTILKASSGEYTKIISYRNGVYGISGWASLVSAKKATVVQKSINAYGFQNANARVVSAGKETEEKSSPEDLTQKEETLTVPKLKELLKEAGLTVSGNKAQLEERYAEYLKSKETETETSEEDEEEVDDETSDYKVLEVIEYDDGTKAEVGEILSLTEEEAGEYEDGLLEKVEA